MMKRILKELKGAGLLLFVFVGIPLLLVILNAPRGISF